MAEEVDHVFVKGEDFDSAVMESLVESDIDDIHGYLFEPEYSAEDLRRMELEEATLGRSEPSALW